jgi:dihydropteroate synthase
LAGSLAAAAFALAHGGVQILRVHDVSETRDINRVWEVLGSDEERKERAQNMDPR